MPPQAAMKSFSPVSSQLENSVFTDPQSSLAWQFEVRGAGRMVGDDHVDVPGQDGLPEELLVVLLSDRRTALVLSGPGGDLGRCEVEVVVTSLHSQRQSLLSSGSDEREGGGGREMDDVTGNSGLPAH